MRFTEDIRPEGNNEMSRQENGSNPSKTLLRV
jgi:hypothetical protein